MKPLHKESHDIVNNRIRDNTNEYISRRMKDCKYRLDANKVTLRGLQRENGALKKELAALNQIRHFNNLGAIKKGDYLKKEGNK